ncbi:winged helix-turn-helix domain-containing protein, partial [Streptomyces sp. NPDC001817]|uniref:winged helix-turn-helix domain-containing protein n=1 Tax=Streptomyces sp. NPDC001817 TaxID=3154398 RepID=UPI0033290359
MGTRTRRSLSSVELERRRLHAADLFEQGMRPVRVAEALGVTRQAAGFWHRAWREGGVEALRSKGTGNNAYLSDEQEQELEGLLKAGATAFGWDDQRWTLARIGALVEERFGVQYEILGVWRLLDRLGGRVPCSGVADHGPSPPLRSRPAGAAAGRLAI